MNDLSEVMNNFEYHPPSPMKVLLHEEIRDVIGEVAVKVKLKVPLGREQSLALTKLEEAMFWANAGIARSKDDR